MTGLFLKIVDMSLAASWLILAVALLRLVLKKAPRWISVLLWGVAALRLLLPFSVESALSLIPSAEPMSVYLRTDRVPVIGSGAYAVPSAPGQSGAMAGGTGMAMLRGMTPLFAYLWVLGTAALLFYAAVSCLRLHRRVATAVLYRGNIFRSECVGSPFVLGMVRPRIYLPFQLESNALEPVIAHEEAHICRKDHWWKPLGFLLLALHWFNPLVWLAYVLLCRDIELACDEKVIRKLGSAQRADYASALLSCSVSRRTIAACPLAFGEISVKERVKSVVNYRKPAFWVLLLSLTACVIVTVCFLTNPKEDSFDIKITIPAGSQEAFVYSDTEISPTKGQIIITSGDYPGDTAVVLKPMEVRQENAYDEPAYLTPGMPVKMAAERGAWFKVGISVQNPTDEDIVVFIHIKNIMVRIADSAEDLEQDREADSVPDDAGIPTDPEAALSLDEAISKAILDRSASDMPGALLHAESHYIVSTEENDAKIVVYLQVYESSYNAYDGSLYQERGSNIPTALTFSVDDTGRYILEEYWLPRDGSYYVSDLQEKFPKEALEALDAADEEIQALAQKCYDSAMAQLALTESLEVRIAGLLDAIASSPAASSDPEDYIAAHEAEYQELLGYGPYTLRYCFAEFLAGGQTGLKGHLMRRLLDDLAPDSRLDMEAGTGQAYFDEWKVRASQTAGQHDPDWVEKYQPAVWLLLQMTVE